LLQPVRDIHLYSAGVYDIIPHGDIRYIWIFGGIAVFILIIACINFINLSTAKSANRAKEVGLRKVVGSYKSALVKQFLCESVLYSLISFILALMLLWIGMPYFNLLAGQEIAIPWNNTWFFALILASAFVIGMIAGIYPAFYLSSFKPIQVLKGSISRGFRNSKLRSAMVVFQFTISIVLIIGTFIIYKQMSFILTTKVGFEKDRVVIVQGVNTLGDQLQTFKSTLLQLAEVENVSLTQYLPIEGTKRDQNQFWREGKSQEEQSIGAQVWWVDEDYVSTLGMKVIEGRNFDRDLASDSSAIIINQSMARAFGFQNPIGERIMTWRSWTIIGVVEDFHWENMKDKIQPLTLVRSNWGKLAVVKLKGQNLQQGIQSITAVWKKFMPHQSIRYTFMDERYARMYEDVQRTGNIMASFAILAIIVACLGLFALSAFMVEQRNKEISIRLVLGASLQNIFRLLTHQFIGLVLIAFVIAVPVAYWLMEKWLEDYEYRVTIGWQIFAVAGAGSVIIALLTVSYQSLRAALTNPANNLRTE
jgi:putative ABC transport system permease protein